MLLGEVGRGEREAAYAELPGIEVLAHTGAGVPAEAEVVDVFTRDVGLLPAVAGALAEGKTAIVHAPRVEWRGELLSLYREHGERLRLARPAGCDPRIEAMLEEVGGGEMGKVITVRVIRLADAGADLAALEWWALDALVTLGGAAERVFCRRSALRGETEDQVLSVVRFEGGAIGYAEASTAYPATAERTVIEVVAEEGMLEYDSATSPNRLMGERLEVLEEAYAAAQPGSVAAQALSVPAQRAERWLLELAAAAQNADSPEAVTL